jgi:Ca2+-binding EF-hand superfamily protein
MSTISSLGNFMGMMRNALAMQRPDQQQMFNKVDTDASGTVDQTELTSFAEGFNEKTGIEINTEKALSTNDTDGDGGLSQEEMEAMMGAYMPSPPIMPATGRKSDGNGMNPASRPPPDKQEMWDNIDTDASGTIDETELTSFVEQLAQDTGIEINAEDALAAYDANGDGTLSQEEMDSMMTANMPSSPSHPSSQVIAAYNRNTGDSNSNMISQLLSLFGDSGDENQSYSYLPFNIKA